MWVNGCMRMYMRREKEESYLARRAAGLGLRLAGTALGLLAASPLDVINLSIRGGAVRGAALHGGDRIE